MTSVEKLIALDDEGAIENWAYEAKEAIDQAVPVAKLELARVKALRAATPGSIRSMHDFLTSSSSGGGSSSKVEGNDIHKPACGNLTITVTSTGAAAVSQVRARPITRPQPSPHPSHGIGLWTRPLGHVTPHGHGPNMAHGAMDPSGTSAKCDADISKDEIEEVINNLPSGKSPGPDRLPTRFYKTFSSQLVNILPNVFNESRSRGGLPLVPQLVGFHVIGRLFDGFFEVIRELEVVSIVPVDGDEWCGSRVRYFNNYFSYSARTVSTGSLTQL